MSHAVNYPPTPPGKGKRWAANQRYREKYRERLAAEKRVYYQQLKLTWDQEKMRELWRKLSKRKWELNYEKYLEQNRRNNRLSYQRHKVKRQAKNRAWYLANKEYVSKRNSERHFAEKVERILSEDVTLICERGCGRETLHPTGICQYCRTTTCRKCQKALVQNYIGQRLHEKCRPKGDE